MQNVKNIFRRTIDPRVRDGLWVLRTRKDTTVLEVVMRGMLPLPYPAVTDREHLQATMDWLCAAQDVTGNQGVAAFYDVRDGNWSPAYPETTGYIIPTFYRFADLTGEDSYRQRAQRMADWLLTLQLPNGSFPIGPLWADWERTPIVFDTGQIMLGLLYVFQETGNPGYLTAAQNAGSWLADIQAEDGSWRQFTSNGFVHTYNARVAWAVARLGIVLQAEHFQETAVRNINWVLTQQDEDGWFRNTAFYPECDPLTHTIVYTIRGLLETGILLDKTDYIEAARLAADAMLVRQTEDGFLRARYGAGWRSDVNWCCLTGTAQAAIVWLKLYELTSDEAYLLGARESIEYLKRMQDRKSHNAGVRGGIAGSGPIYGDYEPYRYLNWAAKFFADSLLVIEHVQAKLEI